MHEKGEKRVYASKEARDIAQRVAASCISTHTWLAFLLTHPTQALVVICFRREEPEGDARRIPMRGIQLYCSPSGVIQFPDLLRVSYHRAKDMNKLFLKNLLPRYSDEKTEAS